jgi:hypothetical protein
LRLRNSPGRTLRQCRATETHASISPQCVDPNWLAIPVRDYTEAGGPFNKIEVEIWRNLQSANIKFTMKHCVNRSGLKGKPYFIDFAGVETAII